MKGDDTEERRAVITKFFPSIFLQYSKIQYPILFKGSKVSLSSPLRKI